jgi:hypothetical protein
MRNVLIFTPDDIRVPLTQQITLHAGCRLGSRLIVKAQAHRFGANLT